MSSVKILPGEETQADGVQAYARVMMDLEIKLAKEVYGEPRKTPRHTGEKMQTVDHRASGVEGLLELGAERISWKDQEEWLEDARDCPGQGWLASGDEIWCMTVGARG